MKKVLLVIPFTILLTACGVASVDELIEDPQLFAEVTQECGVLSMQGKDINIEKCQNAVKAQKKMVGNVLKNSGF